MRHSIAAAELVLLSLLPWTASAGEIDDREQLLIFNWADYIAPGLIPLFEAETGADVITLHYESDDLRDEMLLETDGNGYDLAIVNDSSVDLYVRRGWLARVDARALANLRHIDRRWRQVFPTASEYGVPYAWGTVGIAYRSDLLLQPLRRWSQLFRPGPELRGRIAMVHNARMVATAALQALGCDLDTLTSVDVEAATHLMLEQQPFVKTYSYLSISEQSALVSGDVAAAMVFNIDAESLREFEPRITFVTPEEGTILWMDFLTVLESSTRKALAWAFIDFLNRPENARISAEYANFATPNLRAEALLPAEFRANPIIYPPAAVLASTHPLRALPPDAARLVNMAFLRVAR